MTEEIAATPGWLDERLDEAFANLDSPALRTARNQYADCLATAKAPAAPSDLLGGEFDRCRAVLISALSEAGLDETARTGLLHRLDAIEAELTADS